MGFTYYDSDAIQQHDRESLQHYGVLGMKWGERRFQNKDGSLTAAGKKHYEKTGEYGYTYKSHATKKYDRKAAKYAAKADKVASKGYNEKNQKKSSKLIEKAEKFKNRANRSREIDRGEQEYAKNLSTGKALALTMLAGGSVTKGYAQYRAMAGQKGKDFTGQKAMAGIKAARKGSTGSRMAKAAYIRQDEAKKTVGKTAYGINKKISDAGANLIDKYVSDSVNDTRKKKRSH